MKLQAIHVTLAGLMVLPLAFPVAAAETSPGHTVSPGVALSGDRHPSADRWEKPTAPLPEVTGEGVRLPAEASPARKRQIRVEWMNSSQIAAYLRGGGKMAILPVGGFVAGDPHVPVGADGLIAHATALLLADRWGAVVLPPVPYSYAGATSDIAGTVSLSEDATMAYVRHAVDSLLDGGFTQVVILGRPHQRNQLIGMARTVYRDRKQLVIPSWIDLLPAADEGAEQVAEAPSKSLQAAAAMKIIGYPGDFGLSRAAAAPTATDELLDRMRRRGVTAEPVQAAASEAAAGEAMSPAEVSKATAAMRQQAQLYDKLPAVYSRYVEQMLDLEAFAPWSLESWDKAVAACQYDAIPEDNATPVPVVDAKSTEDVVLPADWFVPEVSVEYLRRYRAEFMTAADMAERMKSDPVAILTAGAFEMHGPHAPLATDVISAHSQAVLLAPHLNAIVFPPVYFTYGGATERYPGTVSPSHTETAHYVQAVVDGLFGAGFRRVAIYWRHGPGGAMAERVRKNVYHDTGRIVFSLSARLGSGQKVAEQLGYGRGEDISALTGLKILGHPGVFVVDEPEDVGIRKLPFSTVFELFQMDSRPPWYMGLTTHHLPVRKCVRSGDEDKLIPIMREAAKGYADMPELMDEYLQHVGPANGE